MLTIPLLKSLPNTVTVPSYNLKDVKISIVHFGVGNFFRAHLAYYMDKILALPECQEWGIIGVGLRRGKGPEKKAKDFKAQQGLYSLTETAPNGESKRRIIGSLRGYLLAPLEQEKVLSYLSSAQTKIISLTITEGGYNIDEKTGEFILDDPDVKHDLANPTKPKTVFGYVVEGLRRRKEAGLKGFTILSCDNLRQNGSVSRTAFIGYAKALDPDLAAWIEENVSFPNAMVDRITPSISKSAAAVLNKKSGVQDLEPIVAEDFTQWVLEDKFIAGRPPLEKVGAEFSDEVGTYEHAKIRILNASHIVFASIGWLLGLKHIDEVLAISKVREFVDNVIENDVLPTLKGPKGVDLQAYKQLIFDRFSNPAMADQIRRIAGDLTSKTQVFWTETMRQAFEGKRDQHRLIFIMALFLELLRNNNKEGEPISEPALSKEQLEIAHSDDLKASIELPIFDGWRDLMTPQLSEDIAKARKQIRDNNILEVLPH
ncbi:mannitol dehydrogenase family protein [Aristophania vespae]|uniref:mannitol dehydrogenase family protein n=1 Tax=Aristophania vespae TaxID=2697033 RepID=UPI0023517B5E|nr:mannitol dehydrogenase family protein [Aristophania vespae]UMM63930.1 Polyol:NADP oxidoreductase [Aristophania vespae]